MLLLLVLYGALMLVLWFTYNVGVWFGPEAGPFCFALSLLPVGFSCWLLVETWSHQDEGTGVAILALIVSGLVFGFSLAGLWLARRRPLEAEAGTGLNS